MALSRCAAQGELHLEPYITHRFQGIDAVPAALDAMHKGDCLRAVVHM
jgi:S-(hydroxymethyl)glutathione dehydrogenase/alcohol dehydrogenase